MLDSETKRRIDTARDILVGKVPDPKSQVEQITIALIYKFMDDMDAEAEEFGGVRKFFAGDFARYGWAKLMRSGLGGYETLNLYAEAIAKMPENPGIPLLFRDIFKNAYLPYRDPETLRAFLKVIDEFTYDHSERLGDAFEYLLSVLGSQGDAGQFRTPRHIIDFIVAIVDPKKDETVLDPACGTAGFLISSYKHILRANTSPGGVEGNGRGNGEAGLHTSTIPTARGDLLTPDERRKLAANFRGYDISPDMVRLSLVNMYLHGFSDPHIHEYDTLTSQDRWNEYADVILANPPFMSPKGGIRPHNRFSVQSKRSEVLFVDYMAEHLTPNGRAGIIVPEGVIFQSGTAYKQLRQMLVENYLVAVVSLPAGVFNPYAGVKTSVLILDKALARQSNTIAFFKVENDGFGLGAQRRPIDMDDLPEVRAEITEYLGRLQARDSVEDFQPTVGIVVPKERIAANGDYNLSGERYRENGARVSAWPIVPVAEVFRKSDQAVMPDSLVGPVVYVGLENITQNTGALTGDVDVSTPADIKSIKNRFKPGDILYGKLRPNLNKVWMADRGGICSTDIFVIEPVEGRVEQRLYGYLFRTQHFNDAVLGQLKGAQLPRVGWASFSELRIPLPPLEVQREIVAEIEGYQRVIDGARAVVDNYKPHISIRPEWPMVRVDAIADIQGGVQKSPDRQPKENHRPYLTVRNVQRGYLELSHIERFEVTDAELRRLQLRAGDILIVEGNGSRDHIGRNALFELTGELWVHQNHVIRVRLEASLAIPRFVSLFLNSPPGHEQMLAKAATTSGLYTLSAGKVGSLEVPLPPLETQQAIVAEIEAEQALVAANRELIERFEKKIQAAIARVWGEDGEPTRLEVRASSARLS